MSCSCRKYGVACSILCDGVSCHNKQVVIDNDDNVVNDEDKNMEIGDIV